jgi:hypothetical protein
VDSDRDSWWNGHAPVNPYPEPKLLLADREGYPFAVPQGELAKRLVIRSPEEQQLTDEYGPRG